MDDLEAQNRSNKVAPVMPEAELVANSPAAQQAQPLCVQIPSGLPAGTMLQLSLSGRTVNLRVPMAFSRVGGVLSAPMVLPAYMVANPRSPGELLEVHVPPNLGAGEVIKVTQDLGDFHEDIVVTVPAEYNAATGLLFVLKGAGGTLKRLHTKGFAAKEIDIDGDTLVLDGNSKERYSDENEARIVRLSLRTEICYSDLVAVVQNTKDAVFPFDLNSADKIFLALDKDGQKSLTIDEVVEGIENDEMVRDYILASGVPLLTQMAKHHENHEKVVKAIKKAFLQIDTAKNEHIDYKEWKIYMSHLRRQRLTYYRRWRLLKLRAYAGHGMEPEKPYSWWHKYMCLPRGFIDDFTYFVRNNHPLFAIFFADEEHPFSRFEKACDFHMVLWWAFCFSAYAATMTECVAVDDDAAGLVHDDGCTCDAGEECKPVGPTPAFGYSQLMVTLPTIVLHQLSFYFFGCPCLLHDETKTGGGYDCCTDLMEGFGEQKLHLNAVA